MEINNIEISFGTLSELIAKIEKSNSGYYLFVNTNTIVETKNNPLLLKSLNNSTINFPDGFPIALLAKLKGLKNAKRIAGPDFTLALLKILEKENKECAFYGGTEEQNKRRIEKFNILFPNLSFISIAEENEKILKNIIKKNKIKYLFVSLGSPKQEIWAYNNYKKINVKIFCIGVAMAYLTGDKKRALEAMRNMNLEWLYRLITEPAHSWRRYLINGPKFFIIALGELFKS